MIVERERRTAQLKDVFAILWRDIAKYCEKMAIEKVNQLVSFVPKYVLDYFLSSKKLNDQCLFEWHNENPTRNLYDIVKEGIFWPMFWRAKKYPNHPSSQKEFLMKLINHSADSNFNQRRLELVRAFKAKNIKCTIKPKIYTEYLDNSTCCDIDEVVAVCALSGSLQTKGLKDELNQYLSIYTEKLVDKVFVEGLSWFDAVQQIIDHPDFPEPLPYEYDEDISVCPYCGMHDCTYG